MPLVPTAAYRNLPEGATARLMGGSGVMKGEPGTCFREASARVMWKTPMLREPLLATNRNFVARSMARSSGLAPVVKGSPGAVKMLPSARLTPKAEMRPSADVSSYRKAPWSSKELRGRVGMGLSPGGVGGRSAVRPHQQYHRMGPP